METVLRRGIIVSGSEGERGKGADSLVLGESLLAHLAQELVQARSVAEVRPCGLPRRRRVDDGRVREVEVLRVHVDLRKKQRRERRRFGKGRERRTVSMRNPSSPFSSQNRIASLYAARRASGFSQLRSGCSGQK